MDKKLAGLFGSGGSPHHDDRCQGGAGGRAGTPTSFHLSRPARPIPNALPLLKADDQRLAQNGGTRTAQVVIVMSASGPEPIVIIIITIATTIIIACTDEATKGIPSDALFARRCRLPNTSAREL